MPIYLVSQTAVSKQLKFLHFKFTILKANTIIILHLIFQHSLLLIINAGKRGNKFQFPNHYEGRIPAAALRPEDLPDPHPAQRRNTSAFTQSGPDHHYFDARRQVLLQTQLPKNIKRTAHHHILHEHHDLRCAGHLPRCHPHFRRTILLLRDILEVFSLLQPLPRSLRTVCRLRVSRLKIHGRVRVGLYRCVIKYEYLKIGVIEVMSVVPKTVFILVAASMQLFETYGIAIFGFGQIIYSGFLMIIFYSISSNKSIFLQPFTLNDRVLYFDPKSK